MANKTCEKCKHIFTTPSQLQIHLKRKTPCDNIKKFKCMHCHALFSFSNSMYRHMKNSCNVIKEEEQKKLKEKDRIELLELKFLELESLVKMNQQHIPVLTQIIPVIQPVQQVSLQPISQTTIETQNNIDTHIDTQNNINVNIVQYNLPYADTEDVLKTILTKGSAFNNYASVSEKDDLSIEDENDYIAKIIIEVQRQINSKSENCNVISSDKEKSIKVFMITENGEKWCYISLDTGIREMSDKTIKLINKSQYILPDKKVFQKLPTDLKQQISETLERIPETYRENKDNIRDKTKPEFKIIFDVNANRQIKK